MTEQEWPWFPFAEAFERILSSPHENVVIPESPWQPPKEEIDQAYSQTLEIARRLPKKLHIGETHMERSSRVKIKDERVPLNFARFFLPANQESTFKLYPFSEDALTAVELYSPQRLLRKSHHNQLFFEFYEEPDDSLGKSTLAIKGTVYSYPNASAQSQRIDQRIDPLLGVGISSVGPRPIAPGNFSILKATLEALGRFSR